jgi:hypothetical protein
MASSATSRFLPISRLLTGPQSEMGVLNVFTRCQPICVDDPEQAGLVHWLKSIISTNKREKGSVGYRALCPGSGWVAQNALLVYFRTGDTADDIVNLGAPITLFCHADYYNPRFGGIEDPVISTSFMVSSLAYFPATYYSPFLAHIRLLLLSRPVRAHFRTRVLHFALSLSRLATRILWSPNVKGSLSLRMMHSKTEMVWW